MRAVAIGDCAGWLHEAAGGRGVILCPALGHEDLCSRRSLALTAARLAEAGLPTLRFDWSGTGDSAGDLDAPGILARWSAELQAAAAFMREKVGVTEIALVGLRFGAALAVEQAASIGAERLVLMAPVVNGHSYVRELSMLAHEAGTSGQSADGSLEVSGFRFPAELLGALRGIDLRRPSERPAGKIFVMAQRRDHASDAFEANLESLGASVWTSFFVGYDRMMSDCLTSRVATEAVDAVVDWLAQDLPTSRSRRCEAAPGLILGDGWQEERILSGEMVGVLTRPTAATEQIEVLLNAGATPHIGAGRQSVTQARRLAAEGMASLRLDLPGIGDSPSLRPDRPHLYGAELRSGLSAIFDQLEAGGFREISLVGTSSGAYQAFETALEDARVRRLVMINPLCFQWNAGDALQVETWHRRRASDVASRLREAEQIPAPADMGALAALALPLAHRFARSSVDALRTLASLGGGTNAVQRKFAQLSQRGVDIVLIYGENDPGREELARWLGPDGADATALPGVEVHFVPGADHLMSTRRARSALEGLLVSACEARPPREAAAA